MTDDDSPQARRTAADSAFSASLERGLSILSAFTGSRSVLGIADLARAAGLTKSTTHRYVATLTKLEYLQQDPETKKYFLGPRSVDLGFAAIDSMELTSLAGPPLQALADETGYTASMGLSDGLDVVYVDRRRSGRLQRAGHGPQPARGVAAARLLHVDGKVLLAYKDAAELRQLLDRTDMARRGPKTITNREQLTAALARVRQSGVAVNDEELAPPALVRGAGARPHRDGHRGGQRRRPPDRRAGVGRGAGRRRVEPRCAAPPPRSPNASVIGPRQSSVPHRKVAFELLERRVALLVRGPYGRPQLAAIRPLTCPAVAVQACCPPGPPRRFQGRGPSTAPCRRRGDKEFGVSEISTRGLNRRSFLKTAAILGGGVPAAERVRRAEGHRQHVLGRPQDRLREPADGPARRVRHRRQLRRRADPERAAAASPRAARSASWRSSSRTRSPTRTAPPRSPGS